MLEQQHVDAPQAPPAAEVEDARWKESEKRLKSLEETTRDHSCRIVETALLLALLAMAFLVFAMSMPTEHDSREVNELHDQMKDVRKYLIEEQLNPCQPGDDYCKWRRLGLIDGLTIQLTPITSGWPWVSATEARDDDNDGSTVTRHPSQIFATH